MNATNEERAEWRRKQDAGETLTQKIHRQLIADGKMVAAPDTPQKIVGAIPDPSQPEVTIDNERGIAYQADRTRSVPYGVVYFAEYAKRAGTDIARRLNAARCEITSKYCTKLLDVGIGSGEFIESSRVPTLGYDVNHVAVEWLKERDLFCDPYAGIPQDVDGVTLWDVLEHMPEPTEFLRHVTIGCYLFVSIPIYANFSRLNTSRHFKPDEHYWYFTEAGLIDFLDDAGFRCIESNDAETLAGRDGIKTFVFRKRHDARRRIDE